MRNFNKIFLTSLFCLTIIPNLVFASWWNPFSWTKKIEKTESEKKEKISTSTLETKATTIHSVKKDKEEIIVSDSNLVKKIAELTIEIDVLVREKEEMQTKYNKLVSQLNSCKEISTSKDNTTSSALSPTCQIIKDDYEKAERAVEETELEWRNDYNYNDNIYQWNNPNAKGPYLEKIEREGKKKVDIKTEYLLKLKNKLDSICEN